ncbi:MAG: hypothetical protein CO108_30755 [Deltaproteobacteria bacterium CG_4_9_14_3_um_filter_63_12]|nr:MAG: hypothetical protein CO108_30755 [Deltaproteobacteria bacterium CG_4_9_14_3_um_filter_63_12]
MAAKGYILVEGKGEVLAAQNLIVRLSQDLGYSHAWDMLRRWTNLHQWAPKRERGGVRNGADWARIQPNVGALLILRDEDDACPRDLAPSVSAQLETLKLPFPVAYVLLHPEYEVLFLPCLSRMRPEDFPPDVAWDRASWEARRGVKEWLTAQLPPGREYKPTAKQLAMTRCLDFQTLREAEVPCFGSLERALRFLGDNFSQQGSVYP